MMKKRVLGLFLVMVMLLGVLAACGNKNSGGRTDKSDIFTRYEYGSEFGLASKEAIKVPKLSEMEYEHVDTTELIEMLENLTEKVPEYTDAKAFFEDYYKVYELYKEFQSSWVICYLRYSQDTSDEYYIDEYNYCNEQSDIVGEDFSDLYAALAESPLREELEEKYFCKGFLDDYEGYESASEHYFELKDEESALEMKYLTLRADEDCYERYDEVAEIFIELVKVRQEIAKERGYDNYVDYIYKEGFNRDYTPEQVRTFLDSVKEYMVPLTKDIYASDLTYSSSDTNELVTKLYDATQEMGGPIAQAAKFLTTYELYDFDYSEKKRDIGYTWYIPKYEAPHIFANTDAYRTLCHEFGHFTEALYDYNDWTVDTDTAEIYSQAMEYLAMSYTPDFTEEMKTKYLKESLAILLSALKRTCIGGDFELQIYSLNPEELTASKIEEIYRSCQNDYNGFDDRRDWIWTHHYFDFPGYYISYGTSVIPSMLIAKEEYEEKGAGVERYIKLLNRTPGKHFLASLEEAGIANPFEEETIKGAAEFLKEFFDLNK